MPSQPAKKVDYSIYTQDISTEDLISQAKERGVIFGKGNPATRLRYLVKLGLIPAPRRIIHRETASHKIPPRVIGYYPKTTIPLLVGIQRLKNKGFSYEQIKKEQEQKKDILIDQDSGTVTTKKPVEKSKSKQVGPLVVSKTLPESKFVLFEKNGLSRNDINKELNKHKKEVHERLKTHERNIIGHIDRRFGFGSSGPIVDASYPNSVNQKPSKFALVLKGTLLSTAVAGLIGGGIYSYNLYSNYLETQRNITKDINQSSGVLGDVLAATSDSHRLYIDADTAVSGTTVFGEDITAPNVVYSLVAGTGIVIGAGQTPSVALDDTALVTSVNDLAGSLTFAGSGATTVTADGTTITISSTDNNTGGGGDITAVSAGSGLTGGGDSGDVTLSVALTSSGTTATTSSASGLEISSGLSLIRGCASGELLTFSASATWDCTAGGSVGYWSRSGTDLSPSTAGDNITTSGNISTSGSGTITSAGLLTGSAGATISGGTATLNNSLIATDGSLSLAGNFNFSGSSDRTILGPSGAALNIVSEGSLNLIATSASTVSIPDNTVNAFNIGSGAMSFDTQNNRVGFGITNPSNAIHIYREENAAIQLESPTAAGTPDGPNSPNTAEEVTAASGNISWSDIDNAKESAGYATASLGGIVQGKFSHYLKVTDFGFSVPGGGTVRGVEVSIERSASSTGNPSINDTTVQLVVGGTRVGENKAVAADWPTSDATATYGGNDNTWGLNLTPAIVNASDFGVILRAECPSGENCTSAGAVTASVKHIQITVYYSTGTDNWLVGTDGSDSGKFKISAASAFGTSQDFIELDTNGDLTLAGTFNAANGGSSSTGINVGTISAAGTNNYGINVGAVSGATNNYALNTSGGNILHTLASSTNQKFQISATTNTGTAGVLDIDVTSATNGNRAFDISYTSSANILADINGFAQSSTLTRTGADQAIVSQTNDFNFYNYYGQITKSGTNDNECSFGCGIINTNTYGIYSDSQNTNTGFNGGGTINRNTYAGFFTATGSTSGTTNSVYGIYTDANSASTGYGIFVDSGSSTTNYGIYVADQTGNTTDYGLYIAGGASYGIYVAADDVYLAGDIRINGDDIFSDGDLSITPAGGDTNIVGILDVNSTSIAGNPHILDLTDTNQADSGTWFFAIARCDACFAPGAGTGSLVLRSADTNDDFVITTDAGITASLKLDTNHNLTIAGELVANFSTTGSFTAATCWDGSGSSALRDCVGSVNADYAEIYPVEQDIDYGDIVAISTNYITSNQNNQVSILKKSISDYQQNVIGIVSNNYGDFSSTGYEFAEETNTKPIALTGRVPVKVSSVNGNIKAGDTITSSYIPGVGMRATKAGRSIGVALEDFTCSTTNDQGLTQEENQSIDESCTGKILVFVEPSWYLGTALANGSIEIEGDSSEPSNYPTTKLSNLSVDEFGVLIDKGRLDGQILTAEQIRKLLAYDTEEKFEDLQAQIDDIYSLVNTYSGQSTESTDSASLANDSQEALDELDQLLSTTDLELDSLIVTGDTKLASTQVAGTFSQDGTLVIDYGKQINVLGSTLYLQNDSLAGNEFGILIDIGGGKITLDTNGNLKIEGSLSAQSVQAQEFIVNVSNDNSKLAGKSSISAGQSQVNINSTAIKPDAIILITPVGQTFGQTLYLANVSDFESFTVAVDGGPAQSNLEFNWLVINSQQTNQTNENSTL